ncbi:Stimulated by retinoic acid protein [Heracleum sosnowskyi]|uniref:Stimulated by retinoic acid protein n=1 Tax=Heracleum sosnowskyi TaxID=360622 RepID=A0AAD8IWZ5_9APIA|nr:Stimulated by retinoic acid protein [Heracleum sosnowskyi]
MSNNKVYSKGQVPFAWENKPGIRKEDTDRGDDDDKGKRGGKVKLPPPPYLLQPESGRASPVNLQNIPLPPCAFQSPISRSGSKIDAYKEEDDPFLIAYRKCTNGSSSSRRRRLHTKKSSSSSSVSILSCKHSCSVRDDSIARISQLPIPKPTKQIIGSFFNFDD